MKLTNAQLLSGYDVIMKLVKLELPIKISFPLLKNIKKMEEIIELIQKKKEELAQKHILKDVNGAPVKARDENGNEIAERVLIADPVEFNKEMNELLSIENEVEIIKISSDIDVKLSIFELAAIEWLFN